MGQTFRILLVIDNIQSARHLRAFLEEAGYVVDSCSLSAANKDRPPTSRPDVVILDTLLLDDEEQHVFQNLRRLSGWSQVPILVVGTILDAESRWKIRSLPADEFIAKPIEPTELLVKVRSVLRLRSYESRAAKSNGTSLTPARVTDDPLANLSWIAATQASEESVETILVELLRQARQLVHFDEGMVCTEVQPGRYGVVVHVGGGKCSLASFYEVGESYTGWLALHQTPLLVKDVDAEARVRMLGREQGLNKALNSFVGFPLVISNHVLGTLEFASYRSCAFDENTIEVLRPVAQIALMTLETARLRDVFVEQVDTLREHVLNFQKDSMPVYRSQAMERVLKAAQNVKDKDCAVLITGETGTGKELVARYIHEYGRRRQLPFVDLNCAAIPETLQESELFGIEKGTATGVDKRLGKCEVAGAGTLFLDEVADMPSVMQAKMLRVLEERTFQRLGGHEKHRLHARIIAATSRDIAEAIREGKLREELYYRLAVIHLYIPPLRERKEDIPPLIRHFVRRFCVEQGRPLLSIPDKTMDDFLRYDWPGNIRELKNAVERAVLFPHGSELKPYDYATPHSATGRNSNNGEAAFLDLAFAQRISIPDLINRYSRFAYERLGRNKVRTSRFLRINYRTLMKRLRQCGAQNATLDSATLRE